jgi:hypothetical protein
MVAFGTRHVFPESPPFRGQWATDAFVVDVSTTLDNHCSKDSRRRLTVIEANAILWQIQHFVAADSENGEYAFLEREYWVMVAPQVG